jgi:hypothetical protein
MGVFLHFDELNRVLFIRFKGTVTDDVLLDRYRQVREWLAIHGHFSNISDFTDVTSFEVTAQGVTQLAATSPLVPDEFLRIMVAPQDEVFGMTRMFEVLGSPTRNNVRIVRTVAEAYRLVGIEAPEFSPVMEL